MKNKILKRTNKYYNNERFGYPQIRLWHRKERTKKNGTIVSPCYHLKCGCCDNTVDICYGGGALSINDVNGSIDDWREILLPLLNPKLNPKDKWIKK